MKTPANARWSSGRTNETDADADADAEGAGGYFVAQVAGAHCVS